MNGVGVNPVRVGVGAADLAAAGRRAGVRLPWPGTSSTVAERRLGGAPDGAPFGAPGGTAEDAGDEDAGAEVSGLADWARLFGSMGAGIEGEVCVRPDAVAGQPAGPETGVRGLAFWHRTAGGAVATLSVAGAHPGIAEVAVFDADRWAGELTRLAAAPGLDRAADEGAGAREATVHVPWHLLLATGAAWREGRPDLAEALIAREAAAHPADGHPRLMDRLRSLHAARGRLSVRVPGGRRFAMLTWVLGEHGWLRLTPITEPSGAVVAFSPVAPCDLAPQVRRLQAVAA